MKKSTFSNFLIIFFSLIFLLNSNAWGSKKIIEKKQSINKTNTANAGDIIVKKWADDKKSAFSFSFDDSFLSHYTNVRPILDQFGFKGTFFIIGGSVHDSIPEWRYGLWWQFVEMAQEGHEMGAHTMTHPHLKGLPVGDENTPGTITYELYQSKKIIQEKIGVPVISFAYPYTEHNTKVDDVTKIYFENGRAIGDTPNPSSLSGNAWYSLTSKEPEFNLPRNTQSDDLDELVDYKNFTKSSINNGTWTIFQGHEVVPFSQIAYLVGQHSWYPISNEWLTELAQWLKNKSDNNDVWVQTIGNVTRYIKERDNFYFNIVSNTSNKITIEVGDGLDNSIFNYPLTTDIVVPNDWNDVVFTQGNITETLTPTTVNGVNYIRANIIPGAGNVIVQNSAALFTITSSTGVNGSITPLGVTSINSGGSQTYTITPNAGYKIESITVDGNPETVTSETAQTYTFNNVTANHSISVTFSAVVIYYTFSGTVLYGNSSNTPLQNITLKLTSVDTTVEATTNAAGEFLFNSLLPGTYQISLTTTNTWGGVNATDALKTVRVFANLDTFTDLQKKAADVNNDGSINSLDALLMVRRFAGLISSFTISDWAFDAPASIIISNQNVTLDIKTLASGDVDGSLIP